MSFLSSPSRTRVRPLQPLHREVSHRLQGCTGPAGVQQRRGAGLRRGEAHCVTGVGLVDRCAEDRPGSSSWRLAGTPGSRRARHDIGFVLCNN